MRGERRRGGAGGRRRRVAEEVSEHVERGAFGAAEDDRGAEGSAYRSGGRGALGATGPRSPDALVLDRSDAYRRDRYPLRLEAAAPHRPPAAQAGSERLA